MSNCVYQPLASVPVTKALNTKLSQDIFNAAQVLMPGGVSSPVRAFKSVGGQPIVFDRVKGPYAWDVDGNRYIDYVGSWGPAICGHAHPEVIASLQEALEKGTTIVRDDFFRQYTKGQVVHAKWIIGPRKTTKLNKLKK